MAKYVILQRDPVTKKYTVKTEKKKYIPVKKPRGIFHKIRNFEDNPEINIKLPFYRIIFRVQDRPKFKNWKPTTGVGRGIKNTLSGYKFIWRSTVNAGIIGENIINGIKNYKIKGKYIIFHRDPVTRKYAVRTEKKKYIPVKKPRGIFHKIRNFEDNPEINIKLPFYRIIFRVQDRPKFKNWKPTTPIGRGVKEFLAANRFIWKSAVNAGIIGENLLSGVNKATTRIVTQKVKKVIENELQDDVSKALVKGVLVPIIKSKRYRKAAKIYHKTAKKFVKFYKKPNFFIFFEKSQIDFRKQIKSLKKDRTKYFNKAFKIKHFRRKGVVAAVNLHRYKRTKAEFRLVKFRKKIDRKSFIHSKKLYKAHKKLYSYTTKRKLFIFPNLKVTFSEIHDINSKNLDKKLAEIGQNNDFVQVVSKSREVGKVLGLRKNTSQKMHAAKRKIDNLQKKIKKKEGKFRKKESALKNKLNTKKRPPKGRKSNPLTKFTKKLKKILKDPKQAVLNAVKGAFNRVLVPVLIPILLLILPILFTLMMLAPTGSVATVALGIYPATEEDLTAAANYYLEIAAIKNADIYGMHYTATSEWRTTFENLGVNTEEIESYPDNFHWNTDPASGTVGYDFHQYKFWAFLSAFNADDNTFSDNSDEDEDSDEDLDLWTFEDVKAQITELFDSQYEFIYHYEPGNDSETMLHGTPVYVGGNFQYYEYEDGSTGDTSTKTVSVEAESDFYYVMNQKSSFDGVILSYLQSKNYAAERIEYYDFLMENLGGHQEFSCPVGGEFSAQSLARKNCQYHYYWNTKNSPLHYGIDIICTQNAKIYAMANGVIQNVGISSFELSAPNLQYFDNDNTYTATISYSNVRLNSGISSGSAVTAGQEIGYATNEKSCGDYTSPYLHISILQENINIDPMLLIE